MAKRNRQTVLITGGSRGIGAAAALAFANRGYDVAITYREKQHRAEEVAAEAVKRGVRARAWGCELTDRDSVVRVFASIGAWGQCLSTLVLNASGGLERDRVMENSRYPWLINVDAQLNCVDAALPLLQCGADIIFVTSHWAHLYGLVDQLPAYDPIAQSKHEGERMLRLRQGDLEQKGIRLLVVTGDMVEGTITAKLLQRISPSLVAQHRAAQSELPQIEDMASAIVAACADPQLPSGHTVVVGSPLQSRTGSRVPVM